jgi:ferredoxin
LHSSRRCYILDRAPGRQSESRRDNVGANGSDGVSGGVRVTIDHVLCNGVGLCADTAPQTFEVREDAKSWVRADAPADADVAAVVAARDLCPWAAISVASESEGAKG